MNNIQGIIFDFNGVLWWDTKLQETAWKDYSTKLRGYPLTDDELATHVHGRNNKHTIEYLLTRDVTDDELKEYTSGKEKTYQQLCLNEKENFKLSPGAKELLDYLVEKNIPHTIATASEINNLRFFFENLKLSQWFDVKKVVYDDGTLLGKPAPDIYVKAAQNINLPPSQCMVIEDAKSGIAAAFNAEIGYIVGLGPKIKHPDLIKLPGINLVICQLDEIIGLLK